jgi:hypothetical protein
MPRIRWKNDDEQNQDAEGHGTRRPRSEDEDAVGYGSRSLR